MTTTVLLRCEAIEQAVKKRRRCGLRPKALGEECLGPWGCSSNEIRATGSQTEDRLRERGV